jgi:glutaredoxin
MKGRYFIVHGIVSCPYCVRAISLLEERNINYIFSQASGEMRTTLTEKYEWPTVPIVVERQLLDGSVESLIGGFDDLHTYLNPNNEEGDETHALDSNID